MSVGVALVSALYTYTATNTGNVFSTGTIHLTLNPATAMFNSTLNPGDTVNQDMQVLNDGTMPLRYAITGLTTASSNGGVADTPAVNTLAAALQLTIRSGLTEANCESGNYTGATVEYGPGPTSDITTARQLVGDITAGQQDPNAAALPGADRVLANGTNEHLCFTVGLPGGDTNAGLSTTVTFAFVSEQTANNP
ncbi:TasA family protein [Lentzea tibetensis]|uniref:TasA family protein n=1 Tax=Lentzea tibetensis TaxID=2591470 RepID=UPI001648A448|nr:TasA family protein [Lentzea tibetensis]